MDQQPTTADRFRRAASDVLGLDLDKLTDAATIDEDLGCDSIDRVELTMAAEEVFGIEVLDGDANACATFGELTRLIERKVAELPPKRAR